MNIPSPAVAGAPLPASSPDTRRITIVRAVVALVWAGLLAIAVGDDIPTTASDVPVLVALLLTAYPLIDVASALVEASRPGARADGTLRVGAALSALAAIGLGIATFTADAGATLVVFGLWAFLSGALQLGVAVRRRRAGDRRLAMLISGSLSTLAGLMFAAASASDGAHLGNLAGYAALGGVFYLVWAARSPRG
jgi:uncharacterized membrane protein HdeD (DUF308 family)